MGEVIARRYKISTKACWGFVTLGIISLALGVFFLVAKELNLFSYPEDRQWILIIIYACEFVIGALAIFCGVINLYRAKKSKSELIVLNDSNLTFADGSKCNVKDIRDVTCHVSKLENTGVGALRIVLNDRVVKYRFVENVVQTHKRLVDLMIKSRKEEN